MRNLFFIITLLFMCGCRSHKTNPDSLISTVIQKHNWKITQVIEWYYGETNYYYDGLIAVKNKPAVKARALGEFDVRLSFNLDSTYSESAGFFESLPDQYSRKWRIQKNILDIKTDLPKNNYQVKPVLYGQFEVIKCYDTLLVLKCKVDKTKWTRTFILEK